mmetsp:Transcript_19783/g.49604  ORF Transcript_19783/g.49604 Transcript_19783/m.49604 type:complete len:249 (-) Transcript_19783:230-976(-)
MLCKTLKRGATRTSYVSRVYIRSQSIFYVISRSSQHACIFFIVWYNCVGTSHRRWPLTCHRRNHHRAGRRRPRIHPHQALHRKKNDAGALLLLLRHPYNRRRLSCRRLRSGCCTQSTPTRWAWTCCIGNTSSSKRSSRWCSPRTSSLRASHSAPVPLPPVRQLREPSWPATLQSSPRRQVHRSHDNPCDCASCGFRSHHTTSRLPGSEVGACCRCPCPCCSACRRLSQLQGSPTTTSQELRAVDEGRE